MKPILRAACWCGLLSGMVGAQTAATPESLTAWPYYKEVRIPVDGTRVRILLDRDVLDKARPDAADLRVYDAAGREVPYELAILRDIDSHSLFTSREVNRAVEGATAVISCDLGSQQPHNEVQVATSGNDFRRFAQVDGSADGVQWATLASQAILFRFSSGGRTAEERSIDYPLSTFRYIRVRVEHDPQVDREAPQITSLGVLRAEHRKGETVSFPVSLAGREADPFQGRPASIWRLDIGGRIPLQSLVLNVEQATFSRPFQLENIDDPAFPQLLASGDLTRTEEHAAAPVRIDFNEQFAHHLKLTVVDDRNPPLQIGSVNVLSAARQIVFRGAAGAIRLYYGNLKGIAAHYDLHFSSDGVFSVPVVLPNSVTANPAYRPEPKPLSERSPWLVYLVLIAACAALAGMLLNLAKASARLTASTNS